jgi:hypothetical protein
MTVKDNEGQWRTVKNFVAQCSEMEGTSSSLKDLFTVQHLDVYVLLIRGGSEILMDLSQDGKEHEEISALLCASRFNYVFILHNWVFVISLYDKKFSDCMRKDCINYLHRWHLQFLHSIFNSTTDRKASSSLSSQR